MMKCLSKRQEWYNSTSCYYSLVTVVLLGHDICNWTFVHELSICKSLISCLGSMCQILTQQCMPKCIFLYMPGGRANFFCMCHSAGNEGHFLGSFFFFWSMFFEFYLFFTPLLCSTDPIYNGTIFWDKMATEIA